MRMSLPLESKVFIKLNKRKDIINEYKSRKLHGGVYTVTNTTNGKYIIDCTANLQSVQNRFQFAVMTGMEFHPKLQKDWKEMGARVFTLETLEQLDQGPETSQVDFMEELKTLERLCRANLDAAKEY